MVVHKSYYVLRRAIDGVRRRPWLHLLSVVTLSAAFLSFAATLTAAVNLDALLARWIGTGELTVYLKQGVTGAEISRLKTAVEQLERVERVTVTRPEDAKKNFAGELGPLAEMAATLPDTTFPTSIDVHLASDASRNSDERRSLAARIARVEIVAEVDLYDDWFERLSAFTLMGRLAAWGLGLLALVVALLVVAAVVRVGVNTRAREIEVLGLVGATDRYVRFPFLLEGALQAVAAMTIAIVALHLLTNSVQQIIGEVMPLIGLTTVIRLGSPSIILLLAGSALVGIVGSRISLRGLVKI